MVVQVEDDGDGDYDSETETVPTKRKANVIRKPCAAEPARSVGSLAAEPAENRKGVLVKGDSVRIREGMIFNVGCSKKS